MSSLASTTPIRIVIVGDASQAQEALRQVGDDAESLGSRMGNFGKALAVGFAAAGSGAAALGGIAVKTAADFQEQMSGIKAVSGATVEQMQEIRNAALRIGKDTSFSASEAASAMEELVKAGVSVTDILNGAADATVNLAAAGEVELAEASTIAANALNQFGLRGQDMTKVVDLIAGAANASAIGVHDFGESLAQSGAVARTVGLRFDDLAVGIAAMGKAGVVGSDAGTSLKTMLTRLVPTTIDANAAMRELGLITASGANKFFDAQGKIKSLAEVSGILKDALKDQTDEQKLATLQVIFGTDAIRAASVMSREGAEGISGLAAAMGEVTAAGVAKERLDNLSGALEGLKGSAETLAITIGTPFLGALEAGTTAVADFLDGIQKRVAKVDFTALEAKLTTILDDVKPDAAKFLNNVKDSIVAGFGVVRDGFKTGIETGDWKPLGESLGKALVDALKAAERLAEDLTDALGELIGKVDWGGLALKFGEQAPTLVLGLVTGILTFDVTSLFSFIGDHWFQILMGAVAIAFLPAKVAGKLAEILGKIPFVGTFLGKVLEWVNSLGAPLRETVQKIPGDFVDGVKRGFDALVPGLGSHIVGAVRGAIYKLFSLAVDMAAAARQLVVSFADNIRASVGLAGESVGRLAGAVVSAARDFGSLLYHAGRNVIQGFIDGIGSMFGAVKNKLSNLTDNLTNWKGPPARDKKLLYGAGRLVIGGFMEGIDSQVPALEAQLNGITSMVGRKGSVAFTPMAVAASVAAGGSSRSVNISVGDINVSGVASGQEAAAAIRSEIEAVLAEAVVALEQRG